MSFGRRTRNPWKSELALYATFRSARTSILLLSMITLLIGCTRSSSPSLPPPMVKVAPAVKSTATRELHLSGSLEAERSIALNFATIGTVERVLVQEGESVRRGQVLARLVTRSYDDALGIAKAKADQAEDAYKRLEPMHRNQTLSDIKWVEVETGVQQARLALSMAQKSLDDAVLKAPEAGLGAKRNIEPGMSGSPLMSAIVLVQTGTMLATAPVPETQVTRVHKGDTARVYVAALGKTFMATVWEIGVVADPLTRTYVVKATVDNPDGELRVGMVADLRVTINGTIEGIVVPPEAVRIDEHGAPYVFVLQGGNKIARRGVEVTGFLGEGTGISQGLTAGELVVISGTPMLSDGMAVRIAGESARAE
jgi:membrane fusion protein, multidrug efflux system